MDRGFAKGRNFGALWVYLLPKRLVTSFVGWFARRRVSRFMIPWFAKACEIDITEAELPMDAYKTWVQFFSRGLRPGARTVSEAGITSPVDGTASASGKITEGKLIQAKGQLYSVAALIGEVTDSRRFYDGQYITLYLSPHDYHRVHMPFGGRIVRWRHIPGTLYPVNASGVRGVPGLFTKNERLVIDVATPSGEFAMVLVGATIVGSIRTPFGPDYVSPFRRRRAGIRQGETSVDLAKGAEVGMFEFGSTVILLFPATFPIDLQITEGEKIKMGQLIAHPVRHKSTSRA
ncbi:archaetidylserine decarboxylase [Alicyclobacillus ferrooxydans]|uniref:phosphatidylserine decarboxylase n=1 Tax=Alicyclobacillus ferrooxydans TaxID=471514 RepID=A0A0P9CJ06_9BACL|nr:archaetidylserine decarboxylase [Alicyclobacillus ferrooxydans]KPV45355.1 hypothetical protein AN477_03130 [Alicyclobacillus ferrooxydans]